MGIIDVKLNDFIFVEHFWIFFIDFFYLLAHLSLFLVWKKCCEKKRKISVLLSEILMLD